MEVREALKNARERLAAISETPQLDAEVLLAEVLNVPRIWLVAHDNDPLPPDRDSLFLNFVERRETGEPIAYILERKEFFGRNFFVSPAVLVPRPETEILVEKALEFLQTLPTGGRVVDLGTGSGCIIISLALELAKRGLNFEYFAIDKSKAALEVARRNAGLLGASNIQFLEGDWFSGVADMKFDCIVSNPPYVDESEKLGPSLKFEPREALFAQDGGLQDIIRILREATFYLQDQGKIFLECGKGQMEQLANNYEVLGLWRIDGYRDLQGIYRVLAFESTGKCPSDAALISREI